MHRNRHERNKMSLVLVIAGLIACVPSAFATTYYVNAASGNDSYNGLYASYQGGSSGPWKTLAKANSAVGSGSNTINVASGTYNESIVETNSGADSSNLLRWLASGTVQINGYFEIQGNNVALQGFTLTASDPSWNGTIQISGSGCYVASNTVINSSRTGISLTDSSSACVVTGNTIQKTWLDGIALHGTNHLIQNNDISDIRCAIGGNSWNDANGIEFFGSGHRFVGNYIHNITFAANPGYSPHIDAFQTYSPGATNCTFEKNRIDLLQSVDFSADQSCTTWMLQGATYITIKNNISRNYLGINTGGGGNSNLTIVANTFLNDLNLNTSYWPSGVGVENVSNCILENNIFYNHYYKGWEAKGSNPGLVVDYNTVYRSSGSYTEIREPHDVWALDPQFVNPSSDWSLQASSPCIDKGASLTSVSDDFNGTSRPQGSGYDIGAIEYGSGFSILLKIISVK